MNWLRAARMYMQENVKNGDTFVWGSNSVVHMTMAQVEELAERVAHTFRELPKVIHDFDIHGSYMDRVMSLASKINVLQDRHVQSGETDYLEQAVTTVDILIEFLESYRNSLQARHLQVVENNKQLDSYLQQKERL